MFIITFSWKVDRMKYYITYELKCLILANALVSHMHIMPCNLCSQLSSPQSINN